MIKFKSKMIITVANHKPSSEEDICLPNLYRVKIGTDIWVPLVFNLDWGREGPGVAKDLTRPTDSQGNRKV